MIKKAVQEECPRCGGKERLYLTKLIQANQYRHLNNAPKWIPQIKELCIACGQWIRFASQSPGIIYELNEAEERASKIMIRKYEPPTD